MDNILNYTQTLQTFQQQRGEAEQKAEGKTEATRAKILEFTAPFENVAMDSSYDLIKDVTKKMLKKAGVPVDGAKKYVQAFKNNGPKGVMDELGKDKPKIFKNSEDITNKLNSFTLQEPEKKIKTRISDLLPDDFNLKEEKIQDRISDNFDKLTTAQQGRVTDLLNQRGATEAEMPDDQLREQFNLAQAERSLREVRSDTEIPVTINQIKDEEFAKVQPLLENSFKTEVDSLHPVYRQKFNDLMEDRVATPKEIPNTLSREKFNLHQTERTLDDLKLFKPSIESDAVKASSLVSKIGSINDGAVGGGALDLITGKLSGQNTKQIAKQVGLGQGQDVVSNATSQALKSAGSSAVSEGEKAGEAGVKAISTAGETDAELGGPEDVVGDVISGVVGLGVFLGGLFGARHVSTKPEDLATNTSFQIGA